MRIATATVSHETNTFTTGTTPLEAFETATGTELLSAFDSGRSLSGIVERLREAGVEVVPTVGAATIPSGTVTAGAFDWIRTELVDRLDEDLDGVCLDLHGSMYAADEPDPEGALLAAVREAVGSDVPVVAALDMHATVTDRMVEHLDGVAGYRTAPHTDVAETGQRAADLLVRAVRDDRDLCLGWERLPMLLAGEQSETETEPMSSLIDRLVEADRVPGVYDASYFLGFPWADTPHAGCNTLVTGDAARREAVIETTADLAATFWEHREAFDFSTPAYSPERALEVAGEASEHPVVVSETGDIPGAGASEDLTDFLVAALSRDDLGTLVLGVVADPESYEACERAGEGSDITLSIGRRINGPPPECSGRVGALCSQAGTNAARVDLDDGTVIVTDQRTNVHRDPSFLREMGVEPDDLDVVVLKSGYLSPSWKELASRRLFALTDGDTNQVLSELPYRQVPRPLYPLDENTEWST